MRTTVDLPEDVHTIVVNIARDSGRSVSATLAEIVTDQVRPCIGRRESSIDPRTGFVVSPLGTDVITSESVRALDDDL